MAAVAQILIALLSVGAVDGASVTSRQSGSWSASSVTDDCRIPATWPALPDSAAIAARPVWRQADGPAGSVPADGADTLRIAVPQYALLRSASGTDCRAVLVIQQRGDELGYWGVETVELGSAKRQLFDLLGTVPPASGY